MGCGEGGQPPQSLSLGTGKTGLGAFHQQIPFELGDGVDHGHRHLADSTGELDTPAYHAVLLDFHIHQSRNGLTDINGVAGS